VILTPNPLLLRTGRERRAGAAIVMARRRTTRWVARRRRAYGATSTLQGPIFQLCGTQR
jgi:hypothetical protein